MKFFMGFVFSFMFIASNASAFVLRSAQNTNRCLDINNNNANDWRYLRNAELFACNGLDDQQIAVLPRGEVNGKLTFVLRMMNRCLEVDQEATQPWTRNLNVQLQPCRGAPHQRWYLESVGPDWQKVRSVADGRCLEIDLNNQHNWRYNNNLQVWPCHAGHNQLWRFDDFFL
jgi:hypothetical protein